jgi:two-component system, cell cycle response regulator DivK
VPSVDLRRDAARPRVLIIDDAEENRDIYRFFLAHDGFDVDVAADGEAGVALAECRPFDVIVMDLTMPKMDGWEATRRLKADALTRAIPIIIVTGYPAPAAKPDGPAAAWDGYLTKPCLPERLEAEIRRILSVRTA